MHGIADVIITTGELKGGHTVKMREACHRTALRADPLALLPGNDDRTRMACTAGPLARCKELAK
jgi:hypothetical protein